LAQRFNVLDHLDYLRLRLIRAGIAWVVATIASYFTLTGFVMNYLIRGEGGLTGLVFLSPAEAFFSRVKLAFALGLVIALPFILYQAWALFAPGMSKGQKRTLLLVIPGAYVLFLAGCLFAFAGVLPIALRFFLSFGGEGLQQEISVGNYVNFLISFVLPFGFLFELPVAVLILTRVGIISPRAMVTKRKYAVFAIFVVAAALTPPDVISQLLLAAPLLVLYELSILLAKLAAPKERRDDGERQ